MASLILVLNSLYFHRQNIYHNLAFPGLCPFTVTYASGELTSFYDVTTKSACLHLLLLPVHLPRRTHLISLLGPLKLKKKERLLTDIFINVIDATF